MMPSRFAINEEVLFWTDPSEVNREEAKKAKIVAIKFTESKVLYDIAIKAWDIDAYYEVLPLCNVDSCFIYSALDTDGSLNKQLEAIGYYTDTSDDDKRIVKLVLDDKLVEISFKDLKKDDVFVLYEDDGKPVKNEELIALGDSYLNNDNIWTIDIE